MGFHKPLLRPAIFLGGGWRWVEAVSGGAPVDKRHDYSLQLGSIPPQPRIPVANEILGWGYRT